MNNEFDLSDEIFSGEDGSTPRSVTDELAG
jgi:hypothetical protein